MKTQDALVARVGTLPLRAGPLLTGQLHAFPRRCSARAGVPCSSLAHQPARCRAFPLRCSAYPWRCVDMQCFASPSALSYDIPPLIAALLSNSKASLGALRYSAAALGLSGSFSADSLASLIVISLMISKW